MRRACSPGGMTALFLALVLASGTSHAAPTLDWIFPAGASRGATVEITLGGKFDQWPVRPYCTHPGVTLKALPAKGKLEAKVEAGAAWGPCLIRVVDDSGASVYKPFIVSHLAEVTAREPDNEPSAALPVALPAVVNGKLQRSGDVDCFAVELKAGQALVASVEANHLLGSPMDGVLQIVSPEGIVLAQNNDAGSLDPGIHYQVATTGTHIVRAFAFPAMPDSTVRFAGGENYIYRLTLTAGPFARQAWPLAVKDGKKDGLPARGWNLGNSGSAGRLLAISPSGFVRVGAEAWANTVVGLLADSEPVVWTPALTGVLDTPLWLSAEARGNAANLVKTRLKKGTDYRLEVWSAGLGLTMFPVARVLDPAGKLVKAVEPKGLHEDAETTFQVAADGEYTLELREAHGIAGDRLACLAHLAVAKPDFSARLGGELVTAEAGKEAVLEVTVTLSGGLKGTPGLRVEGLPATVPWTSEPDKDPAKPVKLKFGPAKDGKIFSGPVKVFVKVGDRAEKQAWTGSAQPGLQVVEPWLHLPAPKAKAAEPAKKK